MYPHVRCSIIYNSQDIKSNLSAHQQIKKMWYIYTQWNITQPLKKNETAICDNINGPRGYYAK